MTPRMVATRFRVFRFVKQVMVDEGRCPTGVEVGAACGLDRSTAAAHLRALDGADGLPLRVPGKAERARERMLEDPHLGANGVVFARISRGFAADLTQLPTDRVMAANVLLADKSAWAALA